MAEEEEVVGWLVGEGGRRMGGEGDGWGCEGKRVRVGGGGGEHNFLPLL